jgi:beta-ribofuranosylaminobenzene 5'-phosphate synthase
MTGRIDRVTVESAARLHFGLLDLGGSLGRTFGGVGASAPGFAARVSVMRAETLRASGPDADRAAEFARRFLAFHGITAGADVRVECAIPSHAGMGSGTQLALCVARALAELYDLDTNAPRLATAVGRARRSAVGTWTFAGGGCVLEGGRKQNDDAVAPLLARLAFPESWRCVVAVPDAHPGVSGSAEAAAFSTLPRPPQHEVERVAYLVLMAMLPAIVEGDVSTFGRALSEVQRLNGGWFATAQGGTFAPGATADLIARMPEWGAVGVGQSSWGPAVYAVVEGDEAVRRLAARVREALDGRGAVAAGAFPATGATVSRESDVHIHVR